MTVLYSKIAKEQVRHLSPDVKQGIRRLMDGVAADPWVGKPLQHDLSGLRSAKFRRYRLIYRYDEESGEIHVYTVRHRQDVYDWAAALLKQMKGRS